jgi:hypothetical protein
MPAMCAAVGRQEESTRLPKRDCATVPEQPELGYDFRSQVEGAAQRLLEKVAAAIDESGKRGDGFAEDLNINPAQLSRALNSRGAHFSLQWLPAVLWRDRNHTVINFLARMAGGEFLPKPVRSREDENEAIRRYLESKGGEVGLDTIRRALGED